MTALLSLACLLAQTDDLLRQLDHDDPDRRAEAAAAIRRLGPRVIPDLERALGHPSIEVRGRAADLLNGFPEYTLRSVLQDPAYVEVRRLWDAVIEAAVWKRPIPREVWAEINDWKERFRNPGDRVRLHSGREILRELDAAARRILHRQMRRVGIDGVDPEQIGGGIQPLIEDIDFLPWVLRASPDPETFEEVYGTLVSVHRDGWLQGWPGWCEEDWRTAVALLVQVRRRPDAPPMELPATRADALALACRGPIVRGIADALGRAFANRERSERESLFESRRERGEESPVGTLRAVYGVLLWLDEPLARSFYRPHLLAPAKAALPAREVPVPERHRVLFGRVKAGEGALRVVREILAHLDRMDGGPEDLAAAAVLLGAIGTRVEEAAR